MPSARFRLRYTADSFYGQSCELCGLHGGTLVVYHHDKGEFHPDAKGRILDVAFL